MSKHVVPLIICGIIAAIFAFVPVVGLIFYGAVIQMLDVFAIANHMYWLDMDHYWSALIGWILFSLVFFAGYKTLIE
jgi:hypothetical protein